MRAALLVVLVVVAAADARAAHVPGDYPTIQAAIDSGEVAIDVSAGFYPETLRIGTGRPHVAHDLILFAVDGDTTVTVLGMTVSMPLGSHTVYVRGLRMLGRLSETKGGCDDGIKTWEACRFDAGVEIRRGCDIGSSDTRRFVGCLVLGELRVKCDHGSIQRCIVSGTIRATFSDAGGDVSDCTVFGPGLTGIDFYGGDSRSEVVGNLVLGATDGIRAYTRRIEGNVVGRCSGNGIICQKGEVRSNTSYLNGGDGYVGDGSFTIMQGNIAFGNGGVGLRVIGHDSGLSCNDWFGNVAGATAGPFQGGDTDLSVDPLFCDVDHDNVTLRADSPLLAPAMCGPIGARGQGCSSTTRAAHMTWGQLKARWR